MRLILKHGASKDDIAALENELPKRAPKLFNAKKFNGSFKIAGKALGIQRAIRNEWERYPSN